MNSLYSFFDDTFCADNCFNFMNILVKPGLENRTIVGSENELTLENLTSNFVAEYNICKCENGKPELRCDNEVDQFCDKDGCHKNFEYDAADRSCKIVETLVTCEKNHHYVKEEKSCKPNVCYCSYGEVTDKCAEHATHTCKLNTCIEGTVQIQGIDGNVCAKPCDNVLVLDDTWIKPHNSNNIYWQAVKSGINNNNNTGYTFFEAVEYCQSKGTYVSLPTHPEYFNQIFEHIDSFTTWIGLSKFGDISEPNSYSSCSSNDKIRWERGNDLYFNHDFNEDLINNSKSENNTECCVKIQKFDENTFTKSFTDCQEKLTTFICEYSVTYEEGQTKNPDDVSQCCLFGHYWKNSICQPYDEFWLTHSMTTCRCSDKQINYGSDCLKENCAYIIDPQEVKNVYADIANRKMSEEEVQEVKNAFRRATRETKNQLFIYIAVWRFYA